MQSLYRIIGWIILVCAVLTGVLRITALRWWQVPPGDQEMGVSLGPSLQAGDWILLWRLTRPQLGDLVVCPDPDDLTNVVMGRIVAESGDQVTLHGQELKVNDVKPPIEYNCTDRTFSMITPDTKKEVEIFCDMESIDESLHMRGYEQERRELSTFATRVEPGNIFLVSDNRAYPFDSRHFGTLDRRSCKETVFFRLSSKDGFWDVKNRLSYIR